MGFLGLKVIITISATITAIDFIILSYCFHEYSVMFLSIEVILLPAIYIIGNYFTEYLIKREDELIISQISELNKEKDKKIDNLKKQLKQQKNDKRK